MVLRGRRGVPPDKGIKPTAFRWIFISEEARGGLCQALGRSEHESDDNR